MRYDLSDNAKGQLLFASQNADFHVGAKLARDAFTCLGISAKLLDSFSVYLNYEVTCKNACLAGRAALGGFQNLDVPIFALRYCDTYSAGVSAHIEGIVVVFLGGAVDGIFVADYVYVAGYQRIRHSLFIR